MDRRSDAAAADPGIESPNAFELDDDANWAGGAYELAIELGPRDDSGLERALLSTWSHASVDGCYTPEYDSVSGYAPLRLVRHFAVPLTLPSLEMHGRLRGTMWLPGYSGIVCEVFAVREDDGPDWLDFCLPLGALARTEPRIGGFPFGDDYVGSLAWRLSLDDWLAELGRQIFADVPFRQARIGWQASGSAAPDECVSHLVPRNGSLEYEPALR